MIAATTNYNKRRVRAKPADIEKIDFEKAFDIYKESRAGASALTFMFVGSIDTATIKPLLEKYLGSLSSTFKNKA